MVLRAQLHYNNKYSLHRRPATTILRLIGGDQQVDLERLISGAYKWYAQTGSLLGDAPSWTYFCSLWETNIGSAYLISGQDGLSASGSELAGIYAWTPLDDSNRSWLWEMTTNAGLYVAVGVNDTVMTSDDGVNWNTEAIPFTNGVSPTNTTLFGIGGDTNILLAVGSHAATHNFKSTNLFIEVVTTNANGSLRPQQRQHNRHRLEPRTCPHHQRSPGRRVLQRQLLSGGRRVNHLAKPGQRNVDQTRHLHAILSFRPRCNFQHTRRHRRQRRDPHQRQRFTWKSRASGTTNWIFRVRNFGGLLIAVGENGTILTSSNDDHLDKTRLRDHCLA